jgi:Tol biopolymer transport system component
VSRSLHIIQANASSSSSSISSDGRYVAFESYATNLNIPDANGAQDIFVRDRQTGQTTRISVASDSTEGNNDSWQPAISGDGRYVAFYSEASNLVANDTNGYLDVFIHDCQTGETTRLSMDYIHRGPANGDSYDPSISSDGRYVSFTSEASDLVPADTNGERDILVRDRGEGTGQTIRVSLASDGSEGNEESYVSSISANGRQIAFSSMASNLVPDDTNGFLDIFVYTWWEHIYLPFVML